MTVVERWSSDASVVATSDVGAVTTSVVGVMIVERIQWASDGHVSRKEERTRNISKINLII